MDPKLSSAISGAATGDLSDLGKVAGLGIEALAKKSIDKKYGSIEKQLSIESKALDLLEQKIERRSQQQQQALGLKKKILFG